MRKTLRVALFVCAIALLALLVMLDFGSWPRLDMDKIAYTRATSYIIAADGTELAGLYAGENREYCALRDMPGWLPQAFVAAEDERFYRHPGVDVRRIAGALWADIKSLSLREGASTITQQLVRMTMLTNEKTLTRKAQEAYLALSLERRLTKDEIIELYLNTIYFGNAAYGVEAAAQTYFSKSASELTLEESALLAGLVQAPSAYEPDKAPEKALARRAYVLRRMEECGYIDAKARSEADAKALTLHMSRPDHTAYGWYVDAAMEEAMDLLGVTAEAFLIGGYRVTTAMRPDLQEAADLLYETGSRFPADADDGTPAQSAFVAIDPDSGGILCLIGGRSYTARRGLNRAIDIERQPGSAFKPVSVYAAAVDGAGCLPTSLVEDTERDFGGGYSPGNAGGKYFGTVTLRTALSKSLNAASVDLITRVGVSSARDYAERLGLPLARDDIGPSLALGALTNGVSPAKLCAAYAALANGGIVHEPACVIRIEDRHGDVLYERKSDGVRAVRAESASLLIDMLESAVASGSARVLSETGFPVAAKTGTVAMDDEGNRDAWIAACTPTIAVCVWMGFDEPDALHCLPDGSGGSAEPARLAEAFLSAVSDYANGGPFPLAEGITEAEIDLRALEETGSVMLASEYTPSSLRATELFRAGQTPTALSNIWNAPRMVWDLTIGREGDIPVIRFTAEHGAGYRVYRETGGWKTLVGEIVSEADGEVALVDTDADPALEHRYTVSPFHAELWREGILLEGNECAAVSYEPVGTVYGLWEDLFGDKQTAPTQESALPMF